MSKRTDRQLKELRRLMPWTWDSRLEEHPPGQKSLEDFEDVVNYRYEGRKRRSAVSAPVEVGARGKGTKKAKDVALLKERKKEEESRDATIASGVIRIENGGKKNENGGKKNENGGKKNENGGKKNESGGKKNESMVHSEKENVSIYAHAEAEGLMCKKRDQASTKTKNLTEKIWNPAAHSDEIVLTMAPGKEQNEVEAVVEKEMAVTVDVQEKVLASSISEEEAETGHDVCPSGASVDSQENKETSVPCEEEHHNQSPDTVLKTPAPEMDLDLLPGSKTDDDSMTPEDVAISDSQFVLTPHTGQQCRDGQASDASMRCHLPLSIFSKRTKSVFSPNTEVKQQNKKKQNETQQTEKQNVSAPNTAAVQSPGAAENKKGSNVCKKEKLTVKFKLDGKNRKFKQSSKKKNMMVLEGNVVIDLKKYGTGPGIKRPPNCPPLFQPFSPQEVAENLSTDGCMHVAPRHVTPYKHLGQDISFFTRVQELTNAMQLAKKLRETMHTPATLPPVQPLTTNTCPPIGSKLSWAFHQLRSENKLRH